MRAIRCGRWVDIRDAGAAQVALVAARVDQRIRSVGELVSVMPRMSFDMPDRTVSKTRYTERIVLAVDRAARYGLFSPSCLTRALALSRLLYSGGVFDHAIRIGVRREGEKFMAHAWVERDGEILSESLADRQVFSPLTYVAPVGRKHERT